jgi:hypothetical protein
MDEDDEDDEKGEKKTFKEKFLMLQDVSLQIQTILGQIASYGERVFK